MSNNLCTHCDGTGSVFSPSMKRTYCCWNACWDHQAQHEYDAVLARYTGELDLTDDQQRHLDENPWTR